MSSTLERLRRLHGLREQRSRTEPEVPEPRSTAPSPAPTSTPATPQSVPQPAPHSRGNATKLEELVPGEVIENSAGTCYVSTARIPLGQPRGAWTVGGLLTHRPATLHPFHPQFNLGTQPDFRRAAFIDTETTGLGMGAGVYCFMVGVGTFEETASSQQPEFVVRQLFMRHPGEEGALLVALSELLAESEMTVTFNGRTFDLPLLRVRYRQNQRWLPSPHRTPDLLEETRPHLDLLHPARRLWRRRLQSCRLINLEANVLGNRRTSEDVPGHLIPTIYTEYARSEDARQMPGIFYHNHEDIVSMVGIAERLYDAFGEHRFGQSTASTAERHEDAAAADLHGLDWLSLGHCYERKGNLERAEHAFQRALDAPVQTPLDGEGRAEAFKRLGQLQKRQARWEEAAETWQRWLSSVPGSDPTPYIELAKYCEWQTKDVEQAAMWTGWALHNLRTAPNARSLQRQITELEHRLARLERKRQGIDG